MPDMKYIEYKSCETFDAEFTPISFIVQSELALQNGMGT